MNIMGSIGSMMKGSGLEEALETVYGPNAVIHMLSGKAVSRACIVANYPGFAGIIPVFLAFPGSRPVYLLAIGFPGILT